MDWEEGKRTLCCKEQMSQEDRAEVSSSENKGKYGGERAEYAGPLASMRFN